MKLPGFPFRKQSSAGRLDADGLDEDGLEASRQPHKTSRIGKILRMVGMAVFGISIIGGLGAVIGWLVVNGPETVAEREARRPVLTVAIIEDGAVPEPNTSLDSKPAQISNSDSGDNAMAAGDSERCGRIGQDTPTEGQGADDAGQGRGELAEEDQKNPRFDLALVEETENGMLPIVAPDGRKASRPMHARSMAI